MSLRLRTHLSLQHIYNGSTYHTRFAVVVDVAAEFATVGTLSELLYNDDFVLISETIKVLWDKFLKWKDGFEGNGLKVHLWKI